MVSPSRTLRAYFHSGWAFLIPYLAAYLLYAWLRWPVNVAAVGNTEHGARSWVPCLLHVYWALHAIHLVLGGIALRAWWSSSSVLRSPFSILQNIAPWFGLTLLFWIPGIYLEWPSDPWEHLRRINEWHMLDSVTAHSAWKKSSYFLPYSLTSFTTGLPQLGWLNVYYTAVCLLLSWQYYRLARAVGLSERASIIFVLLNTLTFGNSLFSFFRYYGLSSSIIAQLGAVALTRLAMEAAQASRANQMDLDGNPPWSALFLPLRELLLPCASAFALVALTAFNHIQGLGLAGLGVSAIVVWRLLAWRRSMTGWLALGLLLLSGATILWLPRHPALDEVYRPQHWLTLWYGFDLFSPASPAFQRSLHILGVFGGCNLIAGVVLAARNHPAGWLTLSAPLMLVLPFTAVPFANLLIEQDTILTFHRMLLAIPSGLAIACLLTQSVRFSSPARMMAATLALFGIVAIQPAHPANNRFWNSLASSPSDLTYQATIAAYDRDGLPADHAALIGTEAAAFVLAAACQAPAKAAARTIDAAHIRSIMQVLGAPAAMHPAKIHGMLSPNASDWSSTSGILTEFAAAKGGPPAGPAIVQNGVGQAAEILTKEIFPVDRSRSYQIEMSVRMHSRSEGTAYLAIAWYDKNGRLLDAATPAPQGAGDPSGWRNGTYSYFGLVGERPSPGWTTYRISFGQREDRAIPLHAAYARMGALLNSNGSRDAIVQLSRARLWEKSEVNPVSDGTFAEGDALFVFVGNRMNAYSPGSQAGFLSKHWPAQQVAVDHGGGPEFAAAFDGLPVVQENGGRLIRIPPQGSAPSVGNPHD